MSLLVAIVALGCVMFLGAICAFVLLAAFTDVTRRWLTRRMQ